MKQKLIEKWYSFIYPTIELRAIYPFKTEFLIEQTLRNLRHLNQLMLLSEVFVLYLLFFFSKNQTIMPALWVFFILNTLCIIVFRFYVVTSFKNSLSLLLFIQNFIVLNLLILTSVFNIFRFQELMMFHVYLILLVYMAVVLHIPSVSLVLISMFTAVFNVAGILRGPDIVGFNYEIVNIIIFVPIAFYLGVITNQHRILLWMNFHNQKELNENLTDISHRDAMTQLFHHEYILKLLSIEIEQVRKDGKSLCILLLDLDNFKLINDHLGHLRGDEVLLQVVSILKKQVRSLDYVGRYGGDEFLIILRNTNFEEAKMIVRRIAESITHLKLNSIQVSISGGLVMYHQHELEEFIDEADRRLYLAKRMGKNQIIAE